MRNHGNYAISLGNLCRWLGEQAETAGVELYPGFAAAEVLYDDAGAVRGLATGDIGITREGEKEPNYQPGTELPARSTFFAEGYSGNPAEDLAGKFRLRLDADAHTLRTEQQTLRDTEPSKHH